MKDVEQGGHRQSKTTYWHLPGHKQTHMCHEAVLSPRFELGTSCTWADHLFPGLIFCE